MRTLLVDNYDSYTYNLYQLIADTYGRTPLVLTNDAPQWADIDYTDFDALIVSPGPGRPQHPRDLGVCLDLIRDSGLPVLGVCLGHQAIGWLAGADVIPATTPRHGFLERITHTGRELFAGLPRHFTAVRYHSLCVAEPLPREVEATAWADDGVIMGLRHVDRPWWGVQFHPESVATEYGAAILQNFQALVSPRRPSAPPAPRPPRPRAAPDDHLKRRWLTYDSLPGAVDTERTFADLFGGSEHAFWLDSSRVEHGLSRFSFLGDAGGELGEVLSYDVDAGVVEIRDGSGTSTRVRRSIFDVLEDRLRDRAVEPCPELPFDLTCGYVGYFGYEVKADCGSPNRHTSDTADAVWVAATRLVVVDHQEGRTWVVSLCDPEAAPAAERWVHDTLELLCGDDLSAIPVAERGADEGHPPVDPEPWLVRPRATYLADVQECQRQLHAGESYEVCLTTSAELPFHGPPFGLYQRLRTMNPAPYAAYLRLADTHVLCSSPERFVKVGADRIAECKPIKGTLPRHPDPAVDAAAAAELAADPKSRAENLMIVDLVRNDLGRVCEIGSVSVPELMSVESYATVHQLVSTVRGRLRYGASAVQAVRACFPGGSMTGAPKLRTIEITDRLENRARGIYSGAIGFFGLTGTADLNMVIRTAVVHDGRLTVGAGGAIVLDSGAEAEYDEMLLKARAVLRALPAAWAPGELAAPR